MNTIRKLLIFLMLCACMQTWADEWTDSNGIKWSFTVNGTEATDIVMVPTSPLEKHYIYGGPDNPDQQPFQPTPWQSYDMRFNLLEGNHFPTIPDDVYFGLKTIVVEVSDASADCTMKVVNGWWSETYYDNVPVVNGLNEVQITEQMANDCAKGGYARDLTLMLLSGSCTVNAVYYEAHSEVLQAVVIPAKVYAGSKELTVTSIGSAAFAGCNGLTSVTIPSSVTSIGFSAFFGCTGLTSVTIPSGVTTIGDYAFSACTGLTGVTIPSVVTSLGIGAFKGCTGLTSVTIPSGVTTIGYYAFGKCTGLTSVTISSGVTTIHSGAFASCTGLTSVTIPSSVTTIDDNAFINCSSLTSIQVESGNSVYDSRDNCNAIIKTSSNTLIQGCTTTEIPNSITTIGEMALSGFEGLTSITIPEGVTTIGFFAFNASGLTRVTLPSTLTSIGWGAFNYCPLTSVVSMNETPPSIIDEAFTCYDTATLYVPEGCVETYQEALYWQDFQYIVETVEGNVDGDGEVDVADFTVLANYLLGKNPPKFNTGAADVAGSESGGPDGEIDIADLTGIANIILHGNSGAGAPKEISRQLKSR